MNWGNKLKYVMISEKILLWSVDVVHRTYIVKDGAMIGTGHISIPECGRTLELGCRVSALNDCIAL